MNRVNDFQHSQETSQKKKIRVDDLILFQTADKIVDIDSISQQNSPQYFTLKRLDNITQFSNLNFNEETGVPMVHECISIDRNLRVCLSYHGLAIPFPEWFKNGHNYSST